MPLLVCNDVTRQQQQQQQQGNSNSKGDSNSRSSSSSNVRCVVNSWHVVECSWTDGGE
jgi:hypothetical protein